MAFLILTIRSGGTFSILWAVFACSAIFFISSASVGAVVLNSQAIPISLHANEGIVFHRMHILFSIIYNFLKAGSAVSARFLMVSDTENSVFCSRSPRDQAGRPVSILKKEENYFDILFSKSSMIAGARSFRPNPMKMAIPAPSPIPTPHAIGVTKV
jgi:hypothetical protein